MQYKVGDKVIIKSLNWYNANKNVQGYVRSYSTASFTGEMTQFCGKQVTISDVIGKDRYHIEEDNSITKWMFSSYMFADNLDIISRRFEEEKLSEIRFSNPIDNVYGIKKDFQGELFAVVPLEDISKETLKEITKRI